MGKTSRCVHTHVIRHVVALLASANVYWVKALELPKHISQQRYTSEVIQRLVYATEYTPQAPHFPPELCDQFLLSFSNSS